MFIKDFDRVVGEYFCKKCNQKLFNRTNDHFGRDLKTHLESCKGPDQQKHPKLDKLAQPFMPYLKSNKIIQKLFATGQTKLFPKDQEQGVSDIPQPTKNYMCIDAETVEDQAQDDDQIYAQLQPLSIVIGTQIYNKIQSKYFDIRTYDFMNKFIEQMWELANKVNEANLACEPVVKFDNENEQEKHQQKIHQLAIFGFNSKKQIYRMTPDTERLLIESIQIPSDENYALITGCTHGIGKQIAQKLAKQNFRVTIACRNFRQAELYVDELMETTGNEKIHTIQLDLNSFASIRACAEEYKLLNIPLNILINNAGIMDFTNTYGVTEDGIEKHFGINYVGHFLLTHLLLPLLSSCSPSIIINNTNFIKAFAYSKLAMLLFSDEFNRRYAKSRGVRACASHPGASDTNIFKNFFIFKIPYLKNSFKTIVKYILPSAKQVQNQPYTLRHTEKLGRKEEERQQQQEEEQNDDKNPHTFFLGPFMSSVAWRSKQSQDPELARLLWKKTIKMCQLIDEQLH
ncbi:MAG: putative Retinol dehydrogenase 12 [Streblomastix strix]|uniref:Putative Retinol dehydrogenase 12 n=1 Tax=Streblomastix strix TaxID=222440 RepID=A0A5J4VAZ6_9EUKA|nr:MAG: putative Retinol dehydrogenase 12 [Streblomastix strix]